jgi:hypothetical protein
VFAIVGINLWKISIRHIVKAQKSVDFHLICLFMLPEDYSAVIVFIVGLVLLEKEVHVMSGRNFRKRFGGTGLIAWTTTWDTNWGTACRVVQDVIE